jgi:3D (Asp-Asp-Asp) domain-containing protein
MKVACALASLVLACVLWAAPARYHAFKATAYCQRGITRSGIPVHVGVVAADPRVLPLGTRIRVTHAGRYSGVYLVADTGAKVIGHHIDLFIPSLRVAKEFGRQTVLVAVISRPSDKSNG